MILRCPSLCRFLVVAVVVLMVGTLLTPASREPPLRRLRPPRRLRSFILFRTYHTQMLRAHHPNLSDNVFHFSDGSKSGLRLLDNVGPLTLFVFRARCIIFLCPGISVALTHLLLHLFRSCITYDLAILSSALSYRSVHVILAKRFVPQVRWVGDPRMFERQ
jgi:hypothetical protein